jgi:hypothetical protein
MTSISPYYGPDDKRRLQITLAKNLSPEAQYELLATVLDFRDPNEVYDQCPKCDIPSGVKVIYGDPPNDEATQEAIDNGEIQVKIHDEFSYKDKKNSHNYECLNCHHTWLDNSVRIPLPNLEID